MTFTLQEDEAPGKAPPITNSTNSGTFEDAQALFYNGFYDSCAAMTRDLLTSDPENLKVYELRTSALLFQIKRLLGDGADKGQAYRQCDRCDALIAAFQQD